MLKGVRVELIAYTASFRVPSFVGHQLTLPVPPLSTIYGLLSAAAGHWVLPEEVAWLAFRCDYQSKAIDLEAIYQFERSDESALPTPKPYPKTRTVLKREFLTMPHLTLYLPSEWAAPFLRPHYTLLLGRTQDVASAESIVPVTLQPVDAGEVSGVLLPLELVVQNNAPAWLHNLPIALTDEPRRRLLGMKVFGIVDAHRRPVSLRAPNWLVRDPHDGRVVPLYRQEWIVDVIQWPSGEVR